MAGKLSVLMDAFIQAEINKKCQAHGRIHMVSSKSKRNISTLELLNFLLTSNTNEVASGDQATKPDKHWIGSMTSTGMALTCLM